MIYLVTKLIAHIAGAAVLGGLIGWYATRRRAERQRRVLVHQLELTETELRKSEQDGDERERRVRELGTEVYGLSKQRRQLEEEVAEASLNALNLDEQVRSQRESLNGLEEKVRTLQSSNVDLSDRNDELSLSVRSARAEADDAKQTIEVLRATVAERETRIHALEETEAQVADLRRQIEEHSEQMASRETTHQRVVEELHRVGELVNEQSDELESQSAELAAVTERLAASEKALDEASDQLREQMAEAERARTTSGESSAELEAVRAELHAARAELQARNGELARLRAESEKQIQLLDEQRVSYTNALASAQSEGVARAEALEAQVSSLKERIAEAEREHRGLREKLEQRQMVIVDLRQQLRSEEGRLETTMQFWNPPAAGSDAGGVALDDGDEPMAEAEADASMHGDPDAEAAADDAAVGEAETTGLAGRLRRVREKLSPRRLGPFAFKRRPEEDTNSLADPVPPSPASEPVRTLAHSTGDTPPADDAVPPGLYIARPAHADDLTQINGIGVKLQTLLNSLGVYRLEQIASFSNDDMAWLDDHMDVFKGRAERDDWRGQAVTLIERE